MEEVFIEKITIQQVRHLQNLDIMLSSDERKHLILTGKNGSGKTSVLNEIRDYLSDVNALKDISNQKSNFQYFTNESKNLKNQIEDTSDEILRSDFRNKMLKNQQILINIKLQLERFNKINIHFKNQEHFTTYYENNDFIVVFFSAMRLDKPTVPKGVSKMSSRSDYKIGDQARNEFVQYIVNLKAKSSFAREKGDLKTANEINSWFEKFEEGLKEIFDDKNLKLEFDIDALNFNMLLSNREKFDFNTLSDGYSAFLSIVTELIMRMENKSSKNYNIQGVVLIDEIETHLHIDLQKKVLPFLTRFFPKIQFIISTHSPFVLNSIPNAIAYDLENKMQIEDLSGYSVEAIIEGYFDSDKYSDYIKNKMSEFERLLSLPDPSVLDKEKIDNLHKYLRNLPKFNAPELELKLNQLELEYFVK